MINLVQAFPEQLEKAIQIAKNAVITDKEKRFSNVLVCGLGGSGIGGTILSELVFDKANIPVSVTKGYFIPDYVNEKTLVIISSYSGNTEETVNCMRQAIERNAKIVCVSSGGQVQQLAKEHNLDHIILPGGMPPRACFGYSFVQLLFILNHFNIIPDFYSEGLFKSVELLNAKQEAIKTQAMKVADTLKGKIPVIYATTNNEGIAIRFRQQLNENAKILCWHHVFPEMNHNELVGWRTENKDIAVIMLRDQDDYERNQIRFELCKEVFKKYTDTIIELYPEGSSEIEKTFYFIHLVDWVSCYLAEHRGVDATEIAVINHLKQSLADAS